MRYFVHLDETQDPVAVDLEELPSGKLSAHIGGTAFDVDVAQIGKTLSVIVDGKMLDLTLEGNPPDVGFVASGHRSYARVVSERNLAAEAAKRGGRASNDKIIKSPMPGRIVKIMVSAGDVVTAGQPLLVVEAMKMENEVKAKSNATVGEVFVKAGDTVEGNARLLAFT